MTRMVHSRFHVGRPGALSRRQSRRTPEGIEAFEDLRLFVKLLRANGFNRAGNGCPQTRHLSSNLPEMRRF